MRSIWKKNKIMGGAMGVYDRFGHRPKNIPKNIRHIIGNQRMTPFGLLQPLVSPVLVILDQKSPFCLITDLIRIIRRGNHRVLIKVCRMGSARPNRSTHIHIILGVNIDRIGRFVIITPDHFVPTEIPGIIGGEDVNVAIIIGIVVSRKGLPVIIDQLTVLISADLSQKIIVVVGVHSKVHNSFITVGPKRTMVEISRPAAAFSPLPAGVGLGKEGNDKKQKNKIKNYIFRVHRILFLRYPLASATLSNRRKGSECLFFNDDLLAKTVAVF